MRKNSSGFIHIILILVVVVIIGAVLFLGKDKLKSIVQIGTPVPSAMSDPTVGWKQYKNNVFSVKYPSFLPDIKLRARGYGEESDPDTYESTYLDPNEHGGGPGFTVDFRVIGPEANSNNLQVLDWVKQNKRNVFSANGFDQPTDQRTGIFDNKTFVILTDNHTVPPSEYVAYFSTSAGIFSIRYEISSNKEGLMKYQNDFNQILSTFKFQ